MSKIAVVGLSNLFPGSKTPEQFWQNLLDKKDSRTRVTLDKLGAEPERFTGKKGDNDKFYCVNGGYIEDFNFDANGYAIPAQQLSELDDFYQWALHVCRTALKQAGYLDKQDILKKCGVILGTLSFPTQKSNELFVPLYHSVVEKGLKKFLGNKDFGIAPFSDKAQSNEVTNPLNGLIAGHPSALIAQALNLGGANLSLDAACASSVYSVKLACDYLSTGKADLMLAGAVSGADAFFINMGFSIFQAYPENNQSSPLGADSQGLFAGEGAGVLVLKRYEDALRDGDHIHAVVAGGGLSNDGKGQFVLSPNSKGQVLAYERAYKEAQVTPKDVDYIECHATGTPLGDKVELTSMETFFTAKGAAPKIGSVKSNLGHLLTAAGMPGMMKTIMSMNENKIPPTINLSNPITSPKGNFGKDSIPTEVLPWPAKANGAPRRAGVSVFGFGGCNAHLVLEEHMSDAAVENTGVQSSEFQQQAMTIVGMASHFGPCKNLTEFKDTIYQGECKQVPVPASRWKGIEKHPEVLNQFGIAEAPQGAYIDQFDMDFMHFKVPPNEDDRLIPQQLLLMNVADQAVQEAGLKSGQNVAVLVAMGVELEIHQFRGRVNLATQIEDSLKAQGVELTPAQQQELSEIAMSSVLDAAKLNQYTSFIGNIMASRISSLWDFSGPAFTISAEENSVFRCLDVAENLFLTSDVDAVIVAAVDLAGSVENVLLRNRFSQHASGAAAGWTVGEGAGAVVVARKQDAAQYPLNYANIDSVRFVPGTNANAISQSAVEAMNAAGVAADAIDYLELYSGGMGDENQQELAGLSQVYGASDNCVVGSAKTNIGHTFAASGMASIIRTALCISDDFLPATANEKLADISLGATTFKKLNTSKAWSPASSNSMRTAAISGLGMDGNAAHVILSQAQRAMTSKPMGQEQSEKKFGLVKSVVLGGRSIYDSIVNAESKTNLSAEIAKYNLKPLASSHVDIAVASPQPFSEQSLANKSSITGLSKTTKSGSAGMTQGAEQVMNKINSDELEYLSSQTSAHREHLENVAQAHGQFLSSRNSAQQQAAELIELQIHAAAGSSANVSNGIQSNVIQNKAAVPNTVPSSAPNTPIQRKVVAVESVSQQLAQRKPTIELTEQYNKPDQIIWDYDDLVEYSEGSIAKVFGPEYDIIDSYSRRVRLPTTDYLLVTRVTKLDAAVNEYKPCSMTTEYDIPIDAPYLVDGQIPWAVAVESGQCDLMLISYLGIDFENKGDRVYRLLDCTLTFLDDLPKGGETLRYDIKINNFARNGDTLLFFFSYECFVGDKMILKMDGGCAGFFTDKELADGKGVVRTEDEIKERENAVKKNFQPFLQCNKSTFELEEIRPLIVGDVEACFGANYSQLNTQGDQLNPSLCFSSEKFLMIERVTRIEPQGGAWGLGLIEGQKQLEPDHWYFPCHFKGDQVMAGSLMAEGCGQLLQFFMLYLGMQTQAINGRFQPMPGAPQKVRCRGQVLPQSAVLTYRMEVIEIGMSPYPYAKANIDILLDGKAVVDFKNLGVIIKEQGAEIALVPVPERESETASDTEPKALSSQQASANAPLMQAVPDASKPLLKGVTSLQHLEAPSIPDNDNRVPDTVPYTPYHMFEFATGDIAKCFGPEFNIYDGLIPPRTPCGDLQLTTRVTDVKGQRGDLKNTASCVAEYEVPEQAWYFAENSHTTVMPYSILMEISLQPNGFISCYMGTTLGFPGLELFFRNLDGSGELLRPVDLRGKTIVNESTLLSTTISGTNIIQSFDFLLSTDGEPFYKGSAVFGYFKAEALEHQKGMDKGQVLQPWHVQEGIPATTVIDMCDKSLRHYQAPEGQPHYHLAGGRLNFIDRVEIVDGGGKAGKDYLYAERTIDPTDWFFQFHFHQDPVMPGSLGVEAIIELMQVYALEKNLGAKFKSPKFGQILSKISWKYRGQINPLNKQMSLDVHITSVEDQGDKVVIMGDANLSKDGLRIYAISDIAICLEES